MIRFQCPSCGVVMKTGDDAAGKTGKCKRCGVEIIVPSVPSPQGAPPPDDVLAAARDAMGVALGSDGWHVDDQWGYAAPGFPEMPPDAAASIPGPKVLARTQSAHRASPRSRSRRLPGEPWCYLFLELFGAFWLALGLVLGGLQILLGILSLAGAAAVSDNEAIGSAILGFPILLVSGLLTIFFVGLVGAPALIIVDMARNIRAMRFERWASGV